MMGTRSFGGWILSVKLLLLSIAGLSTAVALKIYAPVVLSEVPRIYGFILSWLAPPYIYFIINGIIISIAAASRFQKATEGIEGAQSAVVDPSTTAKAPDEIRLEYMCVAPAEYEVEVVKPAAMETGEDLGVLAVYREASELHGGVEEEEEEEFAVSKPSWTPSERESREIPAEYWSLAEEKPLVSLRVGSRKNVSANAEGKTLRVARGAKRNETLESTWKTITDGRPMRLTRHLKKSDTFDVQAQTHRDTSPVVNKSESFNERRKASPSLGSGSRLRKEPSQGQDKLNRRVEAFINKFNEEMRLQRQDSLQQYLDMVNRGSH